MEQDDISALGWNLNCTIDPHLGGRGVLKWLIFSDESVLKVFVCNYERRKAKALCDAGSTEDLSCLRY